MYPIKIPQTIKNLIPLLVAIAGMAAIILLYSNGGRVEGAAGDNVSGWAWSENIGWISFNCTNTNSCAQSNYGVNVRSNGDIEGYAWSENIGWVSFNERSGCPSPPCKPQLNLQNGEVSGWAKAIGAFQGWDGWISLNCGNQNVCGTSNYKVSVNGCLWEGRAWGSDVIGWLHFRGPNYGVQGTGDGCRSPLSVSCSVSPTTAKIGETVIWTAVASGGQGAYTYQWSGDPPLAGKSGNPAPVTYSTPGTKSGAVTVRSGLQSASNSCSNTVNVSSAIISFTASPSTINPGENSTLSWTSGGMTSCSIDQGIGSVSTNGSTNVSPRTATTYTLSCTGPHGSDSKETAVNVSRIPFFREIKP